MTVGKFNLIYSLSLFYLAQMKMQLLFFSSQENFLKKRRLAMILWAHISISPKCFRSGFREKMLVGSCLDKGIGLTVIVLEDVGKESEANLHYY